MDTTAQISPAGETRNLGFDFTGKAGEYFGIWIVNLLLSIVTVGIYTAWAKVRRLRYFYGNTWLDGHNFEYHARPLQILIGRVIVVVLLVGYNMLVTLSPFFAALLIPYLLALPWLVNKSMAFNARMTSYRNVRLNFRGSYWGGLVAFVLMPLVATVTLGLLAPLASRIANNYVGNRLGYGTARFATDARLGALYGNFGMTIVFAVIISLVVGAVGAGGGVIYKTIYPFSGQGGGGAALDAIFDPMFIGAAIGVYIALFLAFIYYSAGSRNVAFNHTTLDGRHRFSSTVGRARYVWILVSNLFAAILTIGLLRPWAAIRTWRYLAANTAMIAAGTLDSFVDHAAPEGNVGAAEFLDIEGIDFGL